MAGTPGKTGQGQQDLHDFMKTLDELSSSTTAVNASSASTSTSIPTSASNQTTTATTQAEDAQSVLDFLDEITQRSSTPVAPIPTAKKVPSQPNIVRSNSKGNVRPSTPSGGAAARKSTESTRSGKSVVNAAAEKDAASPPPSPGQGGWGWSSMWNQASSVIAQARNVAEENMKNLPQGTPNPGELGEQAKKWRSGVMDMVKKGVDVEKLKNDIRDQGLRTFTDIINAVAPPIAEHEVIQVWLSHDMQGYDGVEELVYRAMAKIMEQVEGGDLIVNRGNEEKPSSKNLEDDDRNLNTVEGLQEAYKLAEANLDALVKRNFQPVSSEGGTDTSEARPPHQSTASTASALAPVTYCPVYMRIQPCLAPLPFFSTPRPETSPEDTAAALTSADADKQLQLFFLLLLRDPTHHIVHRTLTQALPSPWLDIPFEENEWVEDNMVDVIRKGVETVGQAYVMSRHATMATRAPAAASKTEAPTAIASADEPAVAAASAAAS